MTRVVSSMALFEEMGFFCDEIGNELTIIVAGIRFGGNLDLKNGEKSS